MTLIGITALVLLFTWHFGGLLLRFSGLLLVIVGSIGPVVSVDANGILIAVVGAVLWLLGRGHFVLRRGL